MQTVLRLMIVAFLLMLAGCGTAEKAKYSALEKVGIHKRDILVDRIENTAATQEETKQQFQSAYEELASIVKIDDQGLAAQYKQVEKAYKRSEASSEKLKSHIASVDRVANALFEEWEAELDQYTNLKLRQSSAQNLKQTKQRYAAIYKAMQDSYDTVPPVLDVLRDNTLYLKHNLNANAINSLQTEVKAIRGKVDVLIKEMEASITESQQFIQQMKKS